MKIDWQSVKKTTLWSYEDLLGKLQGVLGFSFVQETYNHSMPQAQDFARAIRGGYLHNQGDMLGYIDSIASTLQKLEALRIATYSELVHQVATRERCVDFLTRTGLDFNELVQVLNYLLRWVLPFKTPLREFIDIEDEAETRVLQALKKQNIGSNLVLLEPGRTKAGRIQLARTNGTLADIITALVHRTDISRLAYVRGKTVRHLCGGGYDSLEKIASANLDEMSEKMDAYYHTLGKSLSDFKAVIPLAWMIGGAKILPRLVEV